MEFEERITAELGARTPAAADAFVEANAARLAGDHARALSLYAQVYEADPAFVHALRRQCGEEAALGRRDDALEHCRAAVAQEASAENLCMLSGALLTAPADPNTGWTPSAAELKEAVGAVDAGIAVRQDVFTWTASCHVSMFTLEIERLRACVDALQRIAPDEVETHVYASILATNEERWSDAERELGLARTAGLDPVVYRELFRQQRSARPLFGRIMPTAALIGANWLAGLLLLLGAAWVLSRITLRAASRIPAEAGDGRVAGGEVQGLAAVLRRVYRVVLWLCCAYYYVSLPVLFVGILVMGGAVIYGMLVVGHIPFNLLAIVAVVTLGTLWAIVQSLFVRVKDEDPGRKIGLEDHPDLVNVLGEVALAVGTRPVDSVYLTPGTVVAVTERGGMWRQLAGRRERCLILGAGLLEGMRLGPLKAVLAHEYGHLTNRDTAGGGFALAVRSSLHSMAQSLASSGAAAWYNPAWLFLNGFYRVFLRISQGASRLQEVLADRWAASIYGAAAFEEGLRHVVARSIRFQANIGAVLDEVTTRNIPLWNVYEFQPKKPPDDKEIETSIGNAIERTASPYDSHPSPADRFRWIASMPRRGSASTLDDAREAWSLFRDRITIERMMTADLRKIVLVQSGVEVAPGLAGGWNPPASEGADQRT